MTEHYPEGAFLLDVGVVDVPMDETAQMLGRDIRDDFSRFEFQFSTEPFDVSKSQFLRWADDTYSNHRLHMTLMHRSVLALKLGATSVLQFASS
jgi:hypothetical protein